MFSTEVGAIYFLAMVTLEEGTTFCLFKPCKSLEKG